jgi:hypothetical protein
MAVGFCVGKYGRRTWFGLTGKAVGRPAGGVVVDGVKPRDFFLKKEEASSRATVALFPDEPRVSFDARRRRAPAARCFIFSPRKNNYTFVSARRIWYSGTCTLYWKWVILFPPPYTSHLVHCFSLSLATSQLRGHDLGVRDCYYLVCEYTYTCHCGMYKYIWALVSPRNWRLRGRGDDRRTISQFMSSSLIISLTMVVTLFCFSRQFTVSFTYSAQEKGEKGIWPSVSHQRQ